MPPRPKQRQLIRWNDDLDKSLLLFVTHTCTELGIKIPYDEIARRMGSGFTEGAIQQHIAKLRKHMAEINVAPVPAAPKRGTITSRPSAVYSTKGRSAQAPPPPPPRTQRSRGRAGGGNVPQEVTQDVSSLAKTRGRRGVSRVIKRSGSDDADSDAEYDGVSDDDYEVQQVTNRNKRKRPNENRNQVNTSAQVSLTLSETPTSLDRIVRNIAEADAEYERQEARRASGQLTDATANLPTNFFHGGSFGVPGTSGVGPSGFLGFAPQGDEEEEEEEVPSMYSSQNVHGNIISTPRFERFQDEQISPTNTTHMVQPNAPSMFPQFNSQGQDAFGQFPSFLPQPQGQSQLGSNTTGNQDFDFGGFGMPSSIAAAGHFEGMRVPMGPPALPSVPLQTGGTLPSSPSTRNPSFVSRSSSQGNTTFASPTGDPLGNSQEHTLSIRPSPQCSFPSQSYGIPTISPTTTEDFTSTSNSAFEAPNLVDGWFDNIDYDTSRFFDM